MEEREFLYLVLHFINTTTFVASIFGSGEARRGSIPRSGAVTEEQRSRNRKATQPSGRRCFSAQTLLLTPYRPMKGMRVARVSSGPKIPRRKRGCIYETEYLGRRCCAECIRCSTGPSTPAVIPKRAGRAVLQVLAAMPERSQQHAQMLAQRIKMGLARGSHEWVTV